MAKTRPRKSSLLHLTPSFELFGKSKDIVLKNIWIFGPLYILPIVFMLHSWIWTPAGHNAAHHHWYTNIYSSSSGWSSGPAPFFTKYAFVGFSILWFLIVIVGGFIVQIMSNAAQLEASEDKTVSFDSIWKTTKELGWRMVGLYIVVGLVILGGLILLIVPGLIFLRRYFLTPYVLLDKKISISEAMSISAAMTKPYSRSIWGIIGVMFLISLIGIIPFIGWLISLVLSLLYSVAPAIRYQELKKLNLTGGQERT